MTQNEKRYLGALAIQKDFPDLNIYQALKIEMLMEISDRIEQGFAPLGDNGFKLICSEINSLHNTYEQIATSAPLKSE